MNGLAQTGYCAAKQEYFHGVREHLVFTPAGMLAFQVQLPGNAHDVQGLYALLDSTFRGTLLGDNAYTPRAEKREELGKHGIRIHATPKKNAKLPLAPSLLEWQRHNRAPVERRIALFDNQFHAHRTLNRSERHYRARRAFKQLGHNCSRHANATLCRPIHSVAHFNAAA